MSIILKLDEAVTDDTLRKLDEARIKINGGSDKIRFDFQRRTGSGSITITSLNGNINFYRTDTGASLGNSYTFIDGSPNMYMYAELLTGEDYIIIQGTPNLQFVGSYYSPISEALKADRILTPYDEDFFYQFPSSIELLVMPLPNITDIHDGSFFMERFPNLTYFGTSGIGGSMPVWNCKDFTKGNKLTALAIGSGTALTGDISDLPTSLSQIGAVSASAITFSNEGTVHFPTLTSINLGIWNTSNTVDLANRLLLSFAQSEWSGSKTLTLRGGLTASQLNQTTISTLTGKGVIVTIS